MVVSAGGGDNMMGAIGTGNDLAQLCRTQINVAVDLGRKVVIGDQHIGETSDVGMALGDIGDDVPSERLAGIEVMVRIDQKGSWTAGSQRRCLEGAATTELRHRMRVDTAL